MGRVGEAVVAGEGRGTKEGYAGEDEETRRRRIMQLQREISDDILANSEEERKAAKAKVREEIFPLHAWRQYRCDFSHDPIM